MASPVRFSRGSRGSVGSPGGTGGGKRPGFFGPADLTALSAALMRPLAASPHAPQSEAAESPEQAPPPPPPPPPQDAAPSESAGPDAVIGAPAAAADVPEPEPAGDPADEVVAAVAPPPPQESAPSASTALQWSPYTAAALLNGTLASRVAVLVTVAGDGDAYVSSPADAFEQRLHAAAATSTIGVFLLVPNSKEPAASETYSLLEVAPTCDFMDPADAPQHHLRFLAALVSSPHVAVTLLHAAAVYTMLCGFFGVDAVRCPTGLSDVVDVTVLASVVIARDERTSALHLAKTYADQDGSARLARAAATTFGDGSTPGGAAAQRLVEAAAVVAVVGESLTARAAAAGMVGCANADTAACFACTAMSASGCPVSAGHFNEAIRAAEGAVAEAHVKLLAAAQQQGGSSATPEVMRALGDPNSTTRQLEECTASIVAPPAAGAPASPVRSAAAAHHPVAQAVKALVDARRALQKLHTSKSFAVPAAEAASIPDDAAVEAPPPPPSVVRPTYSFLGTATGRIFASRPNLQTLTPQERRCIAAPAGAVLVAIDYRQIELRVLAALSNDAALLAALASADVISEVARSMFDLNGSAAVASHERAAAKVVTYGLIYGLGNRALQQRLDGIGAGSGGSTGAPSAVQLRAKFFQRYSQAANWLEFVKEAAVSTRRSQSPTGRLQDYSSVGGAQRGLGLSGVDLETEQSIGRRAVALQVQGTAADLLKTALGEVWPGNCPNTDPTAYTVALPIHDEIVFVVREDSAPATVKALSEAMSAVGPKMTCADPSIPQRLARLPVSVKVGHSLGELSAF